MLDLMYALILGKMVNGLSVGAKEALLDCIAHVTWDDDQGQARYDALHAALFPPISITATFTQGASIFTEDSDLDELRACLTVTATLSDNETVTVTGYSLSGTLTEGTSEITVSYMGRTDTFQVTVSASTARVYLYHFDESLSSAGSADFGLTVPTSNYGTGKFGKCVSVGSGTVANAPRASGMAAANRPVFDGDFTVALWIKRSTATESYLRIAKYVNDENFTPTVKSGDYTAYNSYSLSNPETAIQKKYVGFNISSASGTPFIVLWNSDMTKLAKIALNKGFDSTGTWYHVAVCRKNGTVTIFIGGLKTVSFSFPDTLYDSDLVAIGASVSSGSPSVPSGAAPCVDELYINDKVCLYTDEFTPPTGPYNADGTVSAS